MTDQKDSGIAFVGCEFHYHADKPPIDRNPTTIDYKSPRPIVVNGKRMTTIDVHAHCAVMDVLPLVEGCPEFDAKKAAPGTDKDPLDDLETRIKDMDAMGIDVQALSIYLYHHFHWAERDLAAQVTRLQNEKLTEVCEAHLDRFVALGTVSLQHPDRMVAVCCRLTSGVMIMAIIATIAAAAAMRKRNRVSAYNRSISIPWFTIPKTSNT